MDKDGGFFGSPTSVNVDSWLWEFTPDDILSDFELPSWVTGKDMEIKVEVKDEEDHLGEMGNAGVGMTAAEITDDVKFSLGKRKSSSGETKKRNYWSKKGYDEGVRKLVLIMKENGAELGRPIMRQVLRKEASKHIRNSGMLDHMLKHMDGKIVMNGMMRLRRRFNSEGALEYWLEPPELVEVREKAGLSPYWIPPSVWMFGDDVASAFPGCSDDCKAERKKLWEQIKLLNSNIEKLMMGSKDMDKVAVSSHSDLHSNSYNLQLLPLATMKVETDLVVENGDAVSEEHSHGRESMLMLTTASKIPNSVKTKRRKKRSRTPRKVWWTKEWYEEAEKKLVLIMKEKGAEVGHPIMRRVLKEEASKHIRNRGMLDHMLKHMDRKIVMDGTMRLRRWYNSEGVMEYWLEPAHLLEMCKTEGVLDPCRTPSPGDTAASLSFPGCGDVCKAEKKQLWEQVTLLKRNMEQLLLSSKAVNKVAATTQLDVYNVGNSLVGGEYENLEWLEDCLTGIASYENFM